LGRKVAVTNQTQKLTRIGLRKEGGDFTVENPFSGLPGSGLGAELELISLLFSSGVVVCRIFDDVPRGIFD
jgi:hypothetical protein